MKRYFALLLLMFVAQVGKTSSATERVLDGGRFGQQPASAAMPVSASTASDDIGGLPLSEVPTATAGETLALLITGDGGWAELDQNVSAELARRGIPVVALSSLKYFWHSSTPELAARDITKVLRHYLTLWHRSRVVLVGYSFGADVLPFIVNRLSPAMRARLDGVALLGLGANADFEVSVGELVHTQSEPAMPVEPELSRIRDVPLLCVYGEGEQESLCPALPPAAARSVRIGTGHHFGHEYNMLAQQIAALAARSGT